jgi:hypothetical protein
MKSPTRTLVAVSGGAVLVAALVGVAPAHAATTAHAAVQAHSFSTSRYSAYSSGEMLHLNAADTSEIGANIADVEEAFSAGSVSSGGLGHTIVGDGPSGALVVQPAQPRDVHAYGSGGGLAVGLAAHGDPGDQVQLAGLSTSTSSGINHPSKTVEINTSSLGLPSGLIGASVVSGLTKTIWGDSCTLGQPLSYGQGKAAEAQVLGLGSISGVSTLTSGLNTLLAPIDALLAGGGAAPTASSSGYLVKTGSDASARSETYLAKEGNGEFGLTTVEQEDIAPVSLNLLGLATVTIEVGAPITHLPDGLVPTPVDLAATATGTRSGAETSLINNDLLEVLVKAGDSTTYLVPPTPLDKVIGAGGITLDLSLGSVLDPYLEKAGVPSAVLATLGSVLDSSLGTIDLGTPVRAIGGSPTSKPTPAVVGVASRTEGTTASGAFDLAHIDLAPSLAGTTTTLADLDVGHMEAKASLSSPIDCGLPVTTSASTRTLRAGHSATMAVAVPSKSTEDLVSCNLTATKVVDTISGPAFRVTGASPRARVQRHGDRSTTVTWYDLHHRYGTRPLGLSVHVSTPSTAGRAFRSVVTVRTTLQACGGAPLSTLPPQGANGAVITGSAVMHGPDVVRR